MTTATMSFNLSDLIQGRIGTYSLLSRLFRSEVDQPLLDALAQADFALDVDDSDLDEGYALMRKFQQNIGDSTLVDLAVDYVRTFIGTSRARSGAAYPYESVYTSPLRMLMQEARDQVLGIYYSEEVGRAPGSVDPEDHVAFELSFMEHLNRKTLAFFEAGKQSEGVGYLLKQQKFLNDHLLNWVPTLCSDIPRFTRSDLYHGLAKVTRGFLRVDQDVIADLLAELSEPAC